MKRNNKKKMNLAYKLSWTFLGIAGLLLLSNVVMYVLDLTNIMRGYDDIIKVISIAAIASAIIGTVLSFFSKPKKDNELVILTISDEDKD
ncbi:MAG: hypothetical protein ACI4IS_05295 [Acutalibacteraceae bacterium]